MSDIPKDLQYTNEHEWVRRTGDTVQVGITAFAVEQLGDVTMVEVPEVGETITKGETFGTVESVKAVSDLFAPISGEIVAVNGTLEDTPELVNDAPYADGWLVEVRPSNPAELDELLGAEAYAAVCAE